MSNKLRTLATHLAMLSLLLLAGCDGNGNNDVTLLDISLPWETATPAEANINQALLAEAEINASDIPRFVNLLTVHKGKIVQEAYFHIIYQKTSRP